MDLGGLLLDDLLSGALPLKILIFTHRQADPDALCSSEAISKAMTTWLGARMSAANVKIVAPRGASVLGANLSHKLGILFAESVNPAEIESCDLIVSVDTGSPGLLEPYLSSIISSPAKKVLIDHHGASSGLTKGNWKGFRKIVDENATSTCEIVTLHLGDAPLTKRDAEILLAGLLFDSQHLAIATESTLQAALLLVKAGAKIDEAKDLLRAQPDRSEIIARIKSAQRAQYKEIGKYILMKTEVSSFQASVARALIELGADIGIAHGEHEGEARVSVRSTQRFFRETKINLGDLLREIAEEVEGLTGGGHATAASISGKSNASKLCDKVMAKVFKLLPQT